MIAQTINVILPLLTKIYEKLMHTRLMDFINKHNIFKHQYGFRKHAILYLYFNIITANEKQEKGAYIFLDFAKAFTQ